MPPAAARNLDSRRIPMAANYSRQCRPCRGTIPNNAAPTAQFDGFPFEKRRPYARPVDKGINLGHRQELLPLEAHVHVEQGPLKRLLESSLCVSVLHVELDVQAPVADAEADVPERLVQDVKLERGKAAVVPAVGEGEPAEAGAHGPFLGEGELPIEVQHRQRRPHILLLGADQACSEAHIVRYAMQPESGAHLLIGRLEERVVDGEAQVGAVELGRDLRGDRKYQVAELDAAVERSRAAAVELEILRLHAPALADTPSPAAARHALVGAPPEPL